jgi:ketosteroid isomerase-like protein
MKSVNIIIIFTFLVILTSCTQKVTQNNDQAIVDSLINIATTAFNSGDINKLIGIYTDDAVIISGTVKMAGRDSIEKGWKIPLQHSKNIVIYKGLSSVTEDIIFSEGLFTFDWSVDNYSAFCKGIMTIVWKKQSDGSWKITYSAENHVDLVKK